MRQYFKLERAKTGNLFIAKLTPQKLKIINLQS